MPDAVSLFTHARQLIKLMFLFLPHVEVHLIESNPVHFAQDLARAPHFAEWIDAQTITVAMIERWVMEAAASRLRPDDGPGFTLVP